ncbi:hypothetical protein L7F22_051550 [Adiantum nelumboides]|nr:hypothetical protein [Adiantum nelumboides]
MGAEIAAVVGIDSEPSSHRADIEEAQAELRQELTGRNERRRELEFLEKGGDPLEFRLGESLPDLWSSTPPDPLVKHIVSSDGRGDSNDRREENSDYIQEEGSDSKRARGLSGKFYYQEASATSHSVERTDALPATVSSSVENDRKDLSKKELDACKSNKVPVKGQYARRNRQRSNRFSNGVPSSRELGKVGTEGGTISSSALASDAEVKDVRKDISVQPVIINEVALQTSGKDAEVAVVRVQESISAAFDQTEAATTLQISSAHKNDSNLHASEAILLETTKEASASEQDEGTKSLDLLPSIGTEDGRDMSSSLFAPRGGQGQDLLLTAQHDAQAKVTVMESAQKCAPSVTKGDTMEVLDGLKTEVVTGQSDVLVSSSDEAKIVPILEASPAKHESTVDVITTLLVSESTKTVNTESASPGVHLRCDSSNLDKVIKAKGANLLEKEIDTTLQKKSNSLDCLGRTPVPEIIKVKVEDEAPSHSGFVPMNVSDSLKAVGGEAVLDDKMPILSISEDKTDLSIGVGMKNPSGPTKQNVDKTSAMKEAEVCKDPVGDSADRSKRQSFQEAPRKCSHWDFVLQEMAWLANDFMQERLWKIAAAAQLARWAVKEKRQLEFEEMEVCNRQRKLAQGLAKTVRKFWQSVEALLLKEAGGSEGTLIDEALKVESGIKTMKPGSSSAQVRPVQSYAMRFLKDTSERQWISQAEAPSTPDRVSEFGVFDFLEEQFTEESLFYTVPQNAMEVYRQSVVSHWEGVFCHVHQEYEQRLQEHEATMADLERHLSGESLDYPSGTYAVGPLVSPLVTGKRSSGFLGGNQSNRGSIPTKRMRTSAVAARQRAAGGTGPLVSIPVAHLTRSDISSCETNSQQDEMTGFLEGSSVSGRATDVDSSGAFARNNLAVDGVDSPFKSKKKKKIRPLGGHAGSAGCERDSEMLWQHNHRHSEPKEQLKQKGDQGAYHGAASVTSANKLIKQIASRDRNRKHKVGKASLSQPGVGIPWSPVEDQAILGLVHELGLNWELVSDILSATSQLRGIFRKPKDCKERYRMLTDRGGGDGGDSPDDPSSSAHHSFSMTYKGGTRYLPQHLEETLKSHVDCILQLHQQLRSRKLQNESQEPKQLVPEHESHGIKHTAMTPLDLCELSSATGELVSHSYPLQPGGMPSLLPSGVAMRPTSSAVSAIQGVTNLQMSPSMSPSAAINAAATRDAQRMGVSMRPTTAEEQRLRYSRIVAGRGLQTQGLSGGTSGLPLVNLPNTPDGTAPTSLTSGNSAGMMCSLSRGIPVTRTGLPGVAPIGIPNISTGMSNTLQSVGMGLSGANVVNVGAVSAPVNMMRRPREAISMGLSTSTALNNASTSLPNPVASSPTQNFGVQQQLLQHNALQSQQQSPSSSQQQAYNMMRVAKERQQLQQQQQQKRMLQQQQSPTSNTLQSPFQSSQPLPSSQQQHGLSSHAHLFPQHQPSHLIMQPHGLQEQQRAAPSSSLPQLAVSPSRQPSLSGNSQVSQQQQSLSQTHQPTSTASPSQSPFQSKHQSPAVKQQQQQQQQGKNLKGLGRGEGQPNMVTSQVSAQISGQSLSQGQRMSDSQGSSAQNVSANLSHVSDAGAQQSFSQKGFSQHKHIPQQHLTPMSTSSSIQPSGMQQQQLSPGPAGSLPSTQQRRAGQQLQGQQRRPHQSQVGMNLGTQQASQSAKSGLQASALPSQLPAGYQLGANSNNPLTVASPSSGVPLSSPSNTGSGNFSCTPPWKPGQTFTPMAAGLYNLSRSNSGIAAQAPHLAISVGMHLPLPNGKIPATGNNLLTQDITRVSSQQVPGHVGTLPQKAPVGSVGTSRPVGVSQHMASAQQRQLVQQQQLNCTSSSTGGQQLRPASSGTAPPPE